VMICGGGGGGVVVVTCSVATVRVTAGWAHPASAATHAVTAMPVINPRRDFISNIGLLPWLAGLAGEHFAHHARADLIVNDSSCFPRSVWSLWCRRTGQPGYRR
jgi:hypothetical protein